jgi:hypothetical protein
MRQKACKKHIDFLDSAAQNIITALKGAIQMRCKSKSKPIVHKNKKELKLFQTKLDPIFTKVK